MGRYIVIGILYKIKIEDPLDESHLAELKKIFPENLFDHDHISADGCISLAGNITPSAITSLRRNVLSLVDQPFDRDESDLQNQFRHADTIADLDNIAMETCYSSFQHNCCRRILPLSGDYIKATFHWFLIYVMSGKIYPCDGDGVDKIMQATKRLIRVALEDPLSELIDVFING